MPYANNKELEAIRPTVTGIGWADKKQAAVWTKLSHREICNLVAAGEIPCSIIGIKKVRIQYSDLDNFMLSKRAVPLDIDKMADEIFAGLEK